MNKSKKENIKKGGEELVDEKGKIVYDNVIKKYPWIIKKDQKCILSPDSDGFLCGLLMSNFLNWQIVGFYDGKILTLEKGENAKNCIFLDMEIFRNYVKSLGHHMVLYNKKNKPESWFNFSNCIQPNNIRGYDGKTTFNLKYPLGAIHLILGILGHTITIEIKKTAICPLLYTDGTFKNLFNFPENCLSWLNFLCAEEENNPLNIIFFNDHYTTYSLMTALKDFFSTLRSINNDKRGGDKIKISDSSGNPINFNKINDSFCLIDVEKERIIKFLKILGELTGWKFISEKWIFDNFSIYKFKKGNLVPSNQRFNELMEKNPLSWAMTSGQTIEYTLEEPDKLP
jgi:hypothetical protein